MAAAIIIIMFFKYLQLLYFNFYDLFKVSTSKWIPKEESVSNKDLPSITIRNLKPNTQYEARIAIYDDYNTRSLGKSTKTISVRILKGKNFLLKILPNFGTI